MSSTEDAEAFARALRLAKSLAWERGYTAGFYDREDLAGESRDASEGVTRNPYEGDEAS